MWEMEGWIIVFIIILFVLHDDSSSNPTEPKWSGITDEELARHHGEFRSFNPCPALVKAIYKSPERGKPDLIEILVEQMDKKGITKSDLLDYFSREDPDLLATFNAIDFKTKALKERWDENLRHH
jgi:hypothetical protein